MPAARTHQIGVHHPPQSAADRCGAPLHAGNATFTIVVFQMTMK